MNIPIKISKYVGQYTTFLAVRAGKYSWVIINRGFKFWIRRK